MVGEWTGPGGERGVPGDLDIFSCFLLVGEIGT